MPERTRKRPRDLNRLAASVAEAATQGEFTAEDFEGKNPAAVMLGRLGGRKGGRARAKSLSPERRKEIARQAATARWSKDAKGE